MADQTVRVTNLPDSGSPQRVALDLMGRVMQHENAADQRKAYTRKDILDLYAECLAAAWGNRAT